METPPFALPPEMHLFERDGEYLFFDPLSFRWFRTDRLGKAVMDGLARGGTEDGAAEEVAAVAAAPLDKARVYARKALDRLLDVGFVQRGSYAAEPPGSGQAEHPYILYLHMTPRCNLRCPYCYNQDHRTTHWRSERGSREQFAAVIDEAAEIGFVEIKLTGGEPLLNRDTLPLARHARERGLHVNLLTNGTLVSETNAAEIVDSVDSVSLSLDSPVAAEHDAVRGRGTHAKVMRAIRLLRDAGLGFLHLNAVVTPFNRESVEAILRNARDELAAERFSLAPVGIVADPEGRFGADRFSITLAEAEEIYDQERRVLAERPAAPPATGDLFRRQCGAGNGVVSVDANGDLYPCQTMHVPELACGNVFADGLAASLRASGRLAEVRDLTVDRVPRCAECAVRYLCAGGCRMEAYSRHGTLDAWNADRCANLYRRAVDKLWNSTARPPDAAPAEPARPAPAALEAC